MRPEKIIFVKFTWSQETTFAFLDVLNLGPNHLSGRSDLLLTLGGERKLFPKACLEVSFLQ